MSGKRLEHPHDELIGLALFQAFSITLKIEIIAGIKMQNVCEM